MPVISETAYVRLAKNPTALELAKAFTPTELELEYASRQTRSPGPRLAFLLFLKTFQRTGYFTPIADIPAAIVRHVATKSGLVRVTKEAATYDGSSYRTRLKGWVRAFLDVLVYDQTATRIVIDACAGAAATRDDLPDIINVALEQLVLHRYELPAFITLMKIARTARSSANRRYHRQVNTRMSAEAKEGLACLTKVPPEARTSGWDLIKEEPKRPTVKHMREFIQHVAWLKEQVVEGIFAGIPDQKVRQFAAEAATLDAGDLKDIQEAKRFSLMAALIQHRRAQALDALSHMFTRQNESIHNHAKNALEQYRKDHAAITDALVARLYQAILTCQDGSLDIAERQKSVEGVLLEDVEVTLEQCEGHAAIAGNNYIPFLGRFYRSQRRTLLTFFEQVQPQSTSQDRSIEHAIRFVLANKHQRTLNVATTITTNGVSTSQPLVDLSFVSDKWWTFVTGKTSRLPAPVTVNQHYFELCLFAQVVDELKAGDLHIQGSEEFADYGPQLISQEEYDRDVCAFCEQVGFPTDRRQAITKLKTLLADTATKVDQRFPHNDEVKIVSGQPVVGRIVAIEKSGKPLLEQLIRERMAPVDILTALADTELWLGWTKHFGPVSGMEAKIDFPRERYLATAFCYGCGLGPTQTARSLKWLNRKQASLPNHRHVTEADLDETITTVIDAYARIDLHRFWGDGHSAAADGTKLDVHPQSLMTEYHIRYGGYGGIGYYLVSDTYIALFSRFIACGAYEGHTILDFVTEKRTALQPDTIHSDTHGQSAPIFGLSYMLGIDLMPRIRSWEDMIFFRPTPTSRYDHIDDLFTDNINWELIEEHFPDILRVAMSIKAGKLLPSTILRRLGTHSRKNRLYFAFRELGRIIRTVFLLRYLNSAELRRNIGAATNKCERFHQFSKWASFGGAGLVTTAVRDEQRKLIKYNHLVANLLIFHIIVGMVEALEKIRKDGLGLTITSEALSGLSPYINEHINRFGQYELDLSRTPHPLPYGIKILHDTSK